MVYHHFLHKLANSFHIHKTMRPPIVSPHHWGEPTHTNPPFKITLLRDCPNSTSWLVSRCTPRGGNFPMHDGRRCHLLESSDLEMGWGWALGQTLRGGSRFWTRSPMDHPVNLHLTLLTCLKRKQNMWIICNTCLVFNFNPWKVKETKQKKHPPNKR